MNSTSYINRFFIIILIYASSTYLICGSAQLDTLTLQSDSSIIKPWTFIVHIAAANDLSYFANLNIDQMKKVGSTENLNIVIQYIKPGNRKAYRCLVGKNELLNVEILSNNINSGSPEALIDCCQWAIKRYPAQNYALVLWNHGTGIRDPLIRKGVNPSEFFSNNPTNNLLELDRNFGFLDFINALEQKKSIYEENGKRGICYDDRFRTYITNQQLEDALKTIQEKYLEGKKFSLIAFDACLMAMLEIANIVKDYAHVMVGSQELELGAGWPYSMVLEPLSKQNLTPHQFAHHIVNSYQKNYNQITHDYTHSAINLDLLEELEANVHEIAHLLIKSLKNQKNGTIKKIIKMCRQKRICTSFDGANYLDLHHFYRNLLRNLDYFKFKNVDNGNKVRDELRKSLQEGKEILETVVFSNKVGKNLKDARGISIYFPTYRIEQDYQETKFAKSNNWINFIAQYLLL
jgi:Clostripain family